MSKISREDNKKRYKTGMYPTQFPAVIHHNDLSLLVVRLLNFHLHRAMLKGDDAYAVCGLGVHLGTIIKCLAHRREAASRHPVKITFCPPKLYDLSAQDGMPIELIVKYTGLSTEEIEKL